MKISLSLSTLVLVACITSPALSASVTRSNGGGGNSGIPSVANNKNPVCKPWYAIRDAIMGGLFQGRCHDLSRAAIRLAFHDAGTFSLALQNSGAPNGAADGSMIADPNEVLRTENNGLQAIVAALQPFPARFGQSPGDILHMAGVLGVLSCPGGPQVKAYVGRKPPKNIAPDGLLPDTNSPVPVLNARFADMGFSIRETMALIGAHTTGKQRFVDTAVAGSSFDSTVEIWDVRFYRETQNNATGPGTFILPSDRAFSHDPSTVQDFTRFIGKQDNWEREYAKAHEKMSLLGQDVSTLTDCTEVLPSEIEIRDLATVNNAANKGNNDVDPTLDPNALEAAIELQRSIWLTN